ncbi:NarK/NasA family nitrate transporter [SAR92 clade bacterium H231]|nr:NarK/NasA family nitrate transporter [SAR92 clade bacterium H231]
MYSQKQKQWSVLSANTVAFAANFAVWTLFSILGIKIKQDLGLTETQFGVLIATPILTGSISRLPLGILTDLFGGRRVFTLLMICIVPAIYSITLATAYWHYLLIGLFVGLAGGSFAVGIAYTSAWFEKERQGTAMGIFGAGNAGAAITNLAAPILILSYGWDSVPLIYAVCMLVIIVLFWLFTFEDPAHGDKSAARKTLCLKTQLAPLKEMRVWRFGLYYYFVFGGFVALALWLPKYYIGQFGVDLKTASFLTLLFTLPSGLIRALGGWFSDKYGGRTINWWVFWICLVCLFFLSYPPTTMIIHGIEKDISIGIQLKVVPFTVLVFIVGIAMGFGKASVYKVIHDYYPSQMGSVGGMVGVLGGLGGFTLPILFGAAADFTQVRSSCFMLLYAVLIACMILMHYAIKAEKLKLKRLSKHQIPVT